VNSANGLRNCGTRKPESALTCGLNAWGKETPAITGFWEIFRSCVSITVLAIGCITKDTGKEIIVLLCGGDKTTQAADIARARDIAMRPFEEEK
jgi:hypothetical protein